jgi:hypothetical protein
MTNSEYFTTHHFGLWRVRPEKWGSRKCDGSNILLNDCNHIIAVGESYFITGIFDFKNEAQIHEAIILCERCAKEQA